MSKNEAKTRGRVLRGVRRITEHLSEKLNEPDLPLKQVENWIYAGKLRTYRFGGEVTAIPDEINEDLVRSKHVPPEAA